MKGFITQFRANSNAKTSPITLGNDTPKALRIRQTVTGPCSKIVDPIM
jgi:hypothetical protein